MTTEVFLWLCVTSVNILDNEYYVEHTLANAAAAAKSLQSCPTLCDPIDGSAPGSPVPGILQARTLEWVAIAFSNAWKWKVKSESEVAQLLSRVRPSATPWTAAFQAPPSVGFSRQQFWSGVPMLTQSNSFQYSFGMNLDQQLSFLEKA